MSTEGVTTTVYIGNYFEWQFTSEPISGTMTRYYFAGATRVAMREDGGDPMWLLGDHLGSTSVVANYDGSLYSRQGYMPWGETRFVVGQTPTVYQFTGKLNQISLGLYFYNARWYDSALGRFAQPDTIVPATGNPDTFDRFAYVSNNPIKFIDPSGHQKRDEPPEDEDNDDYWNFFTWTRDQRVLDFIGKTILFADVTAMVISYAEQLFVDGVAVILLIGCVGGPKACAGAVGLALTTDVTVTTLTGQVEDRLGAYSFLATAYLDFNERNNYINLNNLSSTTIGVDTLVSGRNALLGLLPEANIDSWTSQAQFRYDLNR